jgi:shikimate kinase
MKTTWQPVQARTSNAHRPRILQDEAREEMRSAFKQRRALLDHISKELSTKSLARRYGVVESTIEKIANE